MRWIIDSKCYQGFKNHPITKRMEALTGLELDHLLDSLLDVEIYDPAQEVEGRLEYFGAVSLIENQCRRIPIQDAKAFCLLVWVSSQSSLDARLRAHREVAFEHLLNYQNSMDSLAHEKRSKADSAKNQQVARSPRNAVKSKVIRKLRKYANSETDVDLWNRALGIMDSEQLSPEEIYSGDDLAMKYCDYKGRERSLTFKSFRDWTKEARKSLRSQG